MPRDTSELIARLESERASALDKVQRLTAANVELQAELEWERQKEQRVVKVAITNVDDESPDAAVVAELRGECETLQRAVQMLGTKRKSDVQKIRSLRDETARLVAELSDLKSLLASVEARATSETTKREALEKRVAALQVERDTNSESGAMTSHSEVQLTSDAELLAATIDDDELVAVLASLLGIDSDTEEDAVDDEDMTAIASLFATDAGRRRFVQLFAALLENNSNQ